jgi:hypothetical protein
MHALGDDHVAGWAAHIQRGVAGAASYTRYRFRLDAGVSREVHEAPARDDQEESERRGDSCPLRPAIAVVRAWLDRLVPVVP